MFQLALVFLDDILENLAKEDSNIEVFVTINNTSKNRGTYIK